MDVVKLTVKTHVGDALTKYGAFMFLVFKIIK